MLSSSLCSYAVDPASSSSSSSLSSSSSRSSKSALHSALHPALHSHHRSSSAPVRTLFSFPHYLSFPTDLTDLVLDFVVPPSHVHKRRKSSSYLLDFDQDDPVSHVARGRGRSRGDSTGSNAAGGQSVPLTASASANATGGRSPSSSSSSTTGTTGAGGLSSRKRRSTVDVLWPVPEDLAISAPPTPMASRTGE